MPDDPAAWISGRARDVPHQAVYDGSPHVRLNLAAPAVGTAEYVYLLLGEGDRLLYVGRSFRPADRLHVHLRKPWGSLVVRVVVLRVPEAPPTRPRARWSYGPNTARLEALLIADAHPLHNVAAPSRTALAS